MAQVLVQGLSPEMERCAVDCLNCHSVCLRTIRYCLQLGGKHVRAEHMNLLLNCAEICQAAENFILSGDVELASEICRVCADVCERCAESCESYGNDMQMKSCAEVCRQCAMSCRNMMPSMAA